MERPSASFLLFEGYRGGDRGWGTGSPSPAWRRPARRSRKMNTAIATVLEEKGSKLWFVPPTATVAEAIEQMAAKRCQALVVLSEGAVVGVITERDCARRVVLAGKNPTEVAVEDVMTSPVVCVGPKHTVGDCIRIITENRATHLPVLDAGRVCGVVSIGDLLRSVVQTQAATIGHLEGYISGKYPG